MDAKFKYLLILTFRIIFSAHCVAFEQNIYISNTTGNDEPNCVRNSSFTCQTLDYVLGIISNTSTEGLLLRNSTKIQVQGDQFLQVNYQLTGLNNFELSGDTNGSVIRCNFTQGLVVLSSKDIVLKHLTFLNCGSKQKAQHYKVYKDISFYAGLFFSNVANVNVTGCVIANSSGIGMALLNVGGHVMFTHTNFTGNINHALNGSKVNSGLAKVAGGLIIEFTYNSSADVQSSSNNTYLFYNCTFNKNGCRWNTELDLHPTEGDENNAIFGCGGGMAMTFKGEAQNNVVYFEYCNFSNNLADWGGGYYILFEDKSLNNYVHLVHVMAELNHGVMSGGAGRFFFGPHINYADVPTLQPNYFKHEYCQYLNNVAGWGGGVSVFGSSVYKVNHETDTNLSFIHSHFVNNQAVVGSALGFLSSSAEQQERLTRGSGLAYTVKLCNCEFRDNKISLTSEVGGKTSVIGTGTIYVDEAPIILKNILFTLNNGTPLVLDLSNAHILGYVNFSDNTGNEGGAVALFGRSRIILGENSLLNFISNKASLRGGAIYAYSQGPNLKAFKVHLLYRSTCFFSYYQHKQPPHNWSARVTFQNNHAPSKSGKSIYTDTLQFCREYGSMSSALQWKPVFTYLNRTNDEPEIVTDPVEINTWYDDWVGFPGQLFSPRIALLDEKADPTNGLMKMLLVNSSTDSGIKLGSRVSEYIYISDGRSSVPISFERNKLQGDFNLHLSSVYTQVIKTNVYNIKSRRCYGGYTFDGENKKKCVCIPKEEMPYGYKRCDPDGETIYLKLGYWATIGKDGQFLVLPCHAEYCKCQSNLTISSYGNDECVFKKFDNNSTHTRQCADNRTGRLCGSCVEGYSVVVGTFECKICTNIGLLWILLMVVGLTLVVLVVVYFEIDFFSGPLNCWIYIYHIVFVLPYKTNYLDPFMVFVISLTSGQFDISTGKCMWNGMDALQKLVLEYLMPFYCILLLYLINKLLRRFPNLPLGNRSFHHAFVTIVIISYAALIQTTVKILHPVGVDGNWYVFEQPDIEYFSKHHLPYAIPALLILCFIVIPFPFIIAFNSYCTIRFQRLRNFIPMFEALQSPYHPNRSWFASYYIFCRLLFVTIIIFRNSYEYTLFPIYEAFCVIVLLLFVLLQPYNDENNFYFKVDTCFLSLLCLIICGMNAANANEERETGLFFQVLVRIFVYIPFIYSLVLFLQYMYRRAKAYQHGRAGSYEPLM